MIQGDEFTMCQRILYDSGQESFKVRVLTADRSEIAKDERCPGDIDACYYTVPDGSPDSKCKETWGTRTPTNVTIYPEHPRKIDSFRNVSSVPALTRVVLIIVLLSNFNCIKLFPIQC